MGEAHLAVFGINDQRRVGLPMNAARYPPAMRCCHFESWRDCGMPDACSTLERDAYIASVIVSYTCSSLQASLNIMQCA